MSSLIYLAVVLTATLIAVLSALVLTPDVLRKDFDSQIKLHVSVKQMKNSEGRIKKFYDDRGLSSEATIYEIADVLNGVEGGIDDTLAERACLCEPDHNGKMVVLFKKGLTKEERKFDFAHECAHLLNGDPIPSTRPGGHNKPKLEQIADYTAAALLMPFDRVNEFLIKNEYLKADKNKRYTLVRKLCQIYGVSEIIVLRRINEVLILKKIER